MPCLTDSNTGVWGSSSSNLVFYAQSTITVISGRRRLRNSFSVPDFEKYVQSPTSRRVLFGDGKHVWKDLRKTLKEAPQHVWKEAVWPLLKKIHNKIHNWHTLKYNQQDDPFVRGRRIYIMSTTCTEGRSTIRSTTCMEGRTTIRSTTCMGRRSAIRSTTCMEDLRQGPQHVWKEDLRQGRQHVWKTYDKIHNIHGRKIYDKIHNVPGG